MIELYKDGDHMAIKTDCLDERDFIQELSAFLNQLIYEGEYEGDWEFQLRWWLPQVIDIACAYRGYKAPVEKRTIYITGSRLVQAKGPAHTWDPRKEAQAENAEIEQDNSALDKIA